jgi:oxygen-independent coproporphyrinogen-3 oxidase
MSEFMLTGLRLTDEGVSASDFLGRFRVDLDERFGGEIGDLTRLGLLEREEDRLRLTRRGRLLGNQVFLRFVE